VALRRTWPWLAAITSGTLLALCFPPWNLSGLVWIALVPLICAVWFSREPPKHRGWRAALLGYVAGIVFFTATFHWLSALGPLFQQPWLSGIPLLLSLYLGLYLAFWGWFLAAVLAPDDAARRFQNSWRNLMLGGLGAAAWVLHEWVRGWLFSGFGWNGLGIALHRELPLIQIADVTGVAGLSFLVAFVNMMAVIVVRRIAGEFGPVFLQRVRWEFSLSVTLVVLVFAYGVRSMRSQPGSAVPLRVTAIQTNIPQLERFSADAEQDIFRQLGNLTRLAAATSQPDLLLWPESAVPRGMYADESNFNFVMEQANLGDFALLFGSIEFLPEHGEVNAAKLLTARGKEEQSYAKIHLVPFGEYLPFRQSFPLFAMVAGDLVPGDFAAGEDLTIFELPKPAVRLSALICFEDTVGDLTRRFVQRGAQLLVNLTNDGWFLETAGAEQHLTNAIFRAIENRRPLIRCTNTGVTCYVDPSGRVDRWLKPFQQGFATRQLRIPTDVPLTFYTRYGDWLAWVALGVTLAAIAWRRRPSRVTQTSSL
ncbi:MAG: apolipoprotein N-acyltransferase, partial [Verrucomicrobiota bacterium]|nr:apolipoprotein N-acyltransferase [Verrucomicrobiota bacterium]